jgi:hypothetical protein
MRTAKVNGRSRGTCSRSLGWGLALLSSSTLQALGEDHLVSRSRGCRPIPRKNWLISWRGTWNLDSNDLDSNVLGKGRKFPRGVDGSCLACLDQYKGRLDGNSKTKSLCESISSFCVSLGMRLARAASLHLGCVWCSLIQIRQRRVALFTPALLFLLARRDKDGCSPRAFFDVLHTRIRLCPLFNRPSLTTPPRLLASLPTPAYYPLCGSQYDGTGR